MTVSLPSPIPFQNRDPRSKGKAMVPQKYIRCPLCDSAADYVCREGGHPKPRRGPKGDGHLQAGGQDPSRSLRSDMPLWAFRALLASQEGRCLAQTSQPQPDVLEALWSCELGIQRSHASGLAELHSRIVPNADIHIRV